MSDDTQRALEPCGHVTWHEDSRERCTRPVGHGGQHSGTSTFGHPDGTMLILDERGRQLVDEGYSREHDDTHVEGSLVQAAIHYMRPNLVRWPWSNKPKLTSEIANLVKAGALIAAEIDRKMRAGLRP